MTLIDMEFVDGLSGIDTDKGEVRKDVIDNQVSLSAFDLQWITPQVYQRYQKWREQFASLKKRVTSSILKGYVEFHPEQLEQELVRQSSYMYYVLELYAEAKLLLSNLEHLVDVVQAKLDAMYRSVFESNQEKFTEGKIRSSILAHPLYDEMKARLIVTEYLVSRIQAVREALNGKKEMLVTYAVNLRSTRSLDGLVSKRED